MGRACGAGTGCGGCQPTIASLLTKAGGTEAEPLRRERLLIQVLPLALPLAS